MMTIFLLIIEQNVSKAILEIAHILMVSTINLWKSMGRCTIAVIRTLAGFHPYHCYFCGEENRPVPGLS